MKTRTEILTEIEQLMSELADLPSTSKHSKPSETQTEIQAGIMPLSAEQREPLHA